MSSDRLSLQEDRHKELRHESDSKEIFEPHTSPPLSTNTKLASSNPVLTEAEPYRCHVCFRIKGV